MRIRWATAVGAAALIALSGGVVTAVGQQQSSAQDCDDGDVVCRLDSIDGRLARMERSMIRGGGGGPRGVSIAVNRYCQPSLCGDMAATACRVAGFERGAPDELQTPSLSSYQLVRATCFD